jgi:hypothetical protein
MATEDADLWVVDIKLAMVKEDHAEVERIARAVMAWANGTYQVDAYLDEVRHLPMPRPNPELTTAEMKHNLHLAIFGPQDGCRWCQGLEHAS